MPNRLTGRKLQERRKRYFREHPLCVHCQAEGLVRRATELDHIIPLFKGGADDESNVQGLCVEHHLAKTRKDMGFRDGGADASGMPTDPDHHWNQG